MKQVQALLIEGDGHGARRRLSAIIAHQPEKTSAIAEAAVALLKGCYDQFILQGVHDFCQDMEFDLPATVTDRIEQTLARRIERTRAWGKILREVTEERLVRECRALIVKKELKGAAQRGTTLLDRADDESETDRYCRKLAAGLAQLPHDRQEALTTVGYIMKAVGPAGQLLADVFSSMARQYKAVEFETHDQASLRLLTEALLAVRPFLPGPMEAGEPDAGQLEKFFEEMHAILRAGLFKRNREDFIDALMVMMEYCPCDPSAIHNLAGVEDRMFTKLGPRAKLTAVRAFGRLGEIETLRRAVMRLASDSEKDDRLKLFTAVMGGLRHRDFFPYLGRMLGKSSQRREEEMIIEVLGRIGNPEAVDLLLERFQNVLKHKHEAAYEERATTLIKAFGRVARTKGLDPAWRNQLIQRVIKLADGENRQLAFLTAHELFSNRLEELKPELKRWAARKAVEAMWAKLTARQAQEASVNGWREPMVTTLKRLGRELLPEVVETATHYAPQYCGGMSALANALQEIGDERAIPLLEMMIRCAMLYQEETGPQAKLFEEKMVDAATGKLRDLDRDDLVHTLFYTLHRIGGEQGIKIILEYADQIQVGRLTTPGPQTLNFLVDIKLKHGRLDKATQLAQTAEMGEKELKGLLSDARGGLLTKKMTRIAAMAALGQARRPEAVGILLEALGDKDPIIATAAHTAMAQFMRPVPSEKLFCEFLDSVLERPGALKGRLLERLLEFLRMEVPKNQPYDRLLKRQVEIALDDGELAHRIRGAASWEAAEAKRKGHVELMDETKQALEAVLSEERGGALSLSLSKLDQRRAYLEARRLWIANGKIGDPPTAPD